MSTNFIAPPVASLPIPQNTTTYVARDGKKFTNAAEYLQHNKNLKKNPATVVSAPIATATCIFPRCDQPAWPKNRGCCREHCTKWEKRQKKTDPKKQ
jgi:hypothetical protein